jgi:hypothetical protein
MDQENRAVMLYPGDLHRRRGEIENDMKIRRCTLRMEATANPMQIAVTHLDAIGVKGTVDSMQLEQGTGGTPRNHRVAVVLLAKAGIGRDLHHRLSSTLGKCLDLQDPGRPRNLSCRGQCQHDHGDGANPESPAGSPNDWIAHPNCSMHVTPLRYLALS